MKPDDILTAIGDVDDKYVKKAHRREALKALFAAVFTFAVLLLVANNFSEPDYILSRLTPDFRINTGYVNPDHIVDDGWTTLKQTSYENGAEVTNTVFKRSLFGNYSVCHNSTDGRRYLLVGSVRGALYRHDYYDRITDRNLYLEAYYENDNAGRINFVVLKKYEDNTTARLMTMLEFEYSGSGFLVKQIQKSDEEVLGYRVIDYTNQKISQTKDYSADGKLLSYAVYTWVNGECCIKDFDNEDNVMCESVCKYDWLGNIRKIETYDAAGSLVSSEVYYYRFWEQFRGVVGLVTLMIILSLSATIGIGVYEDRIRVPRNKESRGSSEFEELMDIEGEIQHLRESFHKLVKNLGEVDDGVRNKAIEEISEIIKDFEGQEYRSD